TEISGEITDSFLVAKCPELQSLLENLDGKSLKEFKAIISSSKKKLKDQLEEIPGRIDELERNKPEPIDENAINSEISDLQTKYNDLESQVENKTEAYNKATSSINIKIQENNAKIHELKL